MTEQSPLSIEPSNHASLRKADYVTGIGIVLFGLAAVIGALTLRWDLPSVEQAGWYTAPGLVPLGVGIILTFQGVLLAVHAGRNGGKWNSRDIARARASLATAPSRRAGLVTLLLLVYVFGLVGRIHFTVASFVFLCARMFLFRAGAWWKILLISAGAAVGISFIFEGLARVPLP